MRGSRVKNIVRELNNEKVDIIRWSADTKELVLEALKPAKIKSIALDEARKAVLIKVDEDQLALAIGKRGQNARLTSRLSGWDINIEQDKSAQEIFDTKKVSAANAFADALQVTPEIASKLVGVGMNSVEVIATGSEPQDIADVLGLDLAAATAIHEAARQEYEKNLAAKQP